MYLKNIYYLYKLIRSLNYNSNFWRRIIISMRFEELYNSLYLIVFRCKYYIISNLEIITKFDSVFFKNLFVLIKINYFSISLVECNSNIFQLNVFKTRNFTYQFNNKMNKYYNKKIITIIIWIYLIDNSFILLVNICGSFLINN